MNVTHIVNDWLKLFLYDYVSLSVSDLHGSGIRNAMDFFFTFIKVLYQTVSDFKWTKLLNLRLLS